MRSLKSLFSLLLLVVMFVSCYNQIEFKKVGWMEKDDLNNYPKREKMLENLMENHNLHRLPYIQVVDLLGEPENYSDIEAGVIYYNIRTEYSGIDPVNVKELKIWLDENKKVKRYIIRG